MLHRNTIITICAIFCAVAIGAGLFVAGMSKQSPLITQQTGTTSLPTNVAAASEPTPNAEQPSATSAPTSAPSAALDPADPTATSQPTPTSEILTEAGAPTSGIPTQGGAPAATTAPASNTTAYIEYTVQKGDLLNNIAKKYNVTTKAILAINQISNADSLTVGQVIRIPKV
jgi:LysM repeat protein